MDCICKNLQMKTKTLIMLLISNVTKKSFWGLVVAYVGLQSISCPSHPPSLKFFIQQLFVTLYIVHVHAIVYSSNCTYPGTYVYLYTCTFDTIIFTYSYLSLHTARCYHVKLHVLSYGGSYQICIFFFSALHQFCVYGQLWSILDSWRVQC